MLAQGFLGGGVSWSRNWGSICLSVKRFSLKPGQIVAHRLRCSLQIYRASKQAYFSTLKNVRCGLKRHHKELFLPPFSLKFHRRERLFVECRTIQYTCSSLFTKCTSVLDYLPPTREQKFNVPTSKKDVTHCKVQIKCTKVRSAPVKKKKKEIKEVKNYARYNFFFCTN